MPTVFALPHLPLAIGFPELQRLFLASSRPNVQPIVGVRDGSQICVVHGENKDDDVQHFLAALPPEETMWLLPVLRPVRSVGLLGLIGATFALEGVAGAISSAALTNGWGTNLFLVLIRGADLRRERW